MLCQPVPVRATWKSSLFPEVNIRSCLQNEGQVVLPKIRQLGKLQGGFRSTGLLEGEINCRRVGSEQQVKAGRKDMDSGRGH